MFVGLSDSCGFAEAQGRLGWTVRVGVGSGRAGVCVCEGAWHAISYSDGRLSALSPCGHDRLDLSPMPF
eukprot:scaffold17390_cov104-Isochrysis_galbana.AAC.2